MVWGLKDTVCDINLTTKPLTRPAAECGTSVSSLCMCDVCVYSNPSHIWCMCVLVCDTCNSYLLCPKVHLTSLFLLSTFDAVLAELQQADLISSEECEGLDYIWGVVIVQSGKSLEVMCETAEVLGRHGFKKESRFLAGRQSSSNRLV